MDALKKQLRFHYVYTRSTMFWFSLVLIGIYGLGVYINGFVEGGCFGTCTSYYTPKGDQNVVSSMTSPSIVITCFFVLFNTLSEFSQRFRVSIGHGTTRNNFLIGLMGYYLGLATVLTLFFLGFLGLDRLILPMINEIPLEYSVMFPSVNGHYWLQAVYAFGLFLFITSIGNLLGVLHYKFGKKIFFVVAGLYISVLFLPVEMISWIMTTISLLFNHPSLAMQMFIFGWMSVIMFFTGWLFVQRFELKR